MNIKIDNENKKTTATVKHKGQIEKIYASNKKKHFIPPEPIQAAKVGRNDPCHKD